MEFYQQLIERRMFMDLYGSLVGFSLDSMDKPFFIFSDLSLHTRNLLINNYASLCVNEYGFKTATDSRISITGNFDKKNKEKYYIEKYIKYHPNADWVNFLILMFMLWKK